MKIDHAKFDPTSGYYVAIITGTGAREQLVVGNTLRCASYRFIVREVIRHYPEAPTPTVAVMLSGLRIDTPQEGMVVHGADEPLTDEELATAVQHLLMLPRLLRGIDAAGVQRRLSVVGVSSVLIPQIARVLELAGAAECFTDTLSSTDIEYAEVERYKADVLRAC